MKKLEIPPEKVDFDSSKLSKKIIIAVVCFVIFIVLLTTGNVIFLLQVFGWLENQVRALTGLDTLIVKGIVALLMSLMFILPISGFIWSFFPVPQKNKKTKRFTVMAIFAVIFFASYFSSRNVFFSPETGEPLKYYSVSPNGNYNFYSSGGYDPITGEQLLPVERKIVEKYLYGYSAGGNNDLVKIGETDSAVNIFEMADNISCYPVHFKNKTGRNIRLVLIYAYLQDSLVIDKWIHVNTEVVLNLMEGDYIFFYLDVNGVFYGDQCNNMIITKADVVERNQDVVLQSLFSPKGKIKPVKAFYLDVRPYSKQAVSLYEKGPKHNKENWPAFWKRVYDSRESIIKVILISLLSLFLIFLAIRLVINVKKMAEEAKELKKMFTKKKP